VIRLRPRQESRIPVEAECISPDAFSGKSAAQVEDMKILWGNKTKRLVDLFEVVEDPAEPNEIVVDGDVRFVKHIGAKMSMGRVIVNGDAGMHLGRGMAGGEIIVNGDAGDWLGTEMVGGLIRVKGNVGNLAGSAYRGSKSGMKGGMIVIEGGAGDELGELMEGGTIAVKGNVQSFAGALMSGGAIVCFGGLGGRPGAGMTNGTLLAFSQPRLLPTFRYARTYKPTFIKPILEELRKQGLPVEDRQIEGLYDAYEGDLACDGKGKILVWKD